MTATYGGASINLINSVIGAGVLALPFALKQCGVILGLVLLTLVAVMSCISLHFLHAACKATQAATYYKLAVHVGGSKLATLVDIISTFYLFGALVSYLVIIADMIHGVATDFGQEFLKNNRILIMALATWGIVFPVSSLRSLHALRHTSLIALACIGYLLLVVVIKASEHVIAGLNEPPALANLGTEIFETVPIIAFAFTCQVQFIPIYAEFSAPDTKRMMWVINGIMFFCFCLYTLFAVLGYTIFHEDTLDNILLNFVDPGDYLVAAGKIALSVVICFSCPLMLAPCRASIRNLAFGDDSAFKTQYEPLSAHADDENVRESNRKSGGFGVPTTASGELDPVQTSPGDPAQTRKWWIQHFAITILLLGAAFGVAVAVPSISVVFGITGAIGACSMAFVFPGLFYLRTTKVPLLSIGGIGGIVLIAAGGMFLVVSTVIWFISVINGDA